MSERNSLIFSQFRIVITLLYPKYPISTVFPEDIEWHRGLSVTGGSWAKSLTNMICLHHTAIEFTCYLSIQPKIFCPITENPSMIKYLTPQNVSRKSAKFWPFTSQQVLLVIGDFNNKYKAILLILIAAIRKYEKTIL